MIQKIDHPNLKKYFWDHAMNASDSFKLKRLLEYAAFPDLLKIPFDFMKNNIHTIDASKLRTSKTRVRFVREIQKEIHHCRNWKETIFGIAGVN